MSNSNVLLATKLFQPKTSKFTVSRPRLLERLEHVFASKVTLVSAPAGYGKTTLIADWANQLTQDPHEVAWYLLDEYDNESTRFLQYFIAALQKIDANVGLSMQEMLQSAQVDPMQQSPEAVMTVLINDIVQSTATGILVLDDLHVIDDTRIISAVRFWVEHAPPHIHTIITSRDASALPLARWRVRTQLTEITSQDLRFTQEEAIAFIRQMVRLDLTDAEILKLTERTEGWIAGLQLAALSLHDTDTPQLLIDQFTGSDRHVMDFLIEEVLQKQPEDLRSFLLQTSILSRLNPALCNAVTQRKDSHILLEQMEKRNLFLVALDNQRLWYRYHPLFAESLHTQLRQGGVHEYTELHSRAFEWCVAEGHLEEAVEHALAAQAYDDAANIMNELVQPMLWQQNRPHAFLRWCDLLPPEVLTDFLSLGMALAWTYLMTHQYEVLEEHLQQLYTTWSDKELAPIIQTELAALEAEIAVSKGNITQVLQILERIDAEQPLNNPAAQALLEQLYGFAYRLDGNVEKSEQHLQKAISLAESGQQVSLWVYTYSDLAETYMMAGRLDDARAVYDKLFKRFPLEQYEKLQYLSFAYIGYGKLLAMGYQLAQAVEFIQRGIDTGRIGDQDTAISQYGYLILAGIRQVQGNWSDAKSFLEKAEAFVRHSQSQKTKAQVAALSAKLHLLQGEFETAKHIIPSEGDPSLSELPRYQQHQMEVMHIRYLCATEPAAALQQLESLRLIAETEQWGESLLELYILRALTQQALAQTEQAFDTLELALLLAEPEGHILPFVMEGALMVQLLRSMPQRTIAKQESMRNFIGRLQASFLPTVLPVAPQPQPLVEPLTPRELEVLGMMANGLSNPEIAEKLIVATGTVAKYSNNIFGKLGVRNRTEAAQQAKTLGIV